MDLDQEEKEANKLADLLADALVGYTPRAVLYALTIVSGNWIRVMVKEEHKKAYLDHFISLIRNNLDLRA
jgi:hypothetical protein